MLQHISRFSDDKRDINDPDVRLGSGSGIDYILIHLLPPSGTTLDHPR